MFVREIELFKEIASHIIDEIAELATEESVPSGHVLFRKGDSADYLYILEEGVVNITIEGQGGTSFPVNQLGQVLGWSALVEPNRYTATAQCVQDSKDAEDDREVQLHVQERIERQLQEALRQAPHKARDNL